MKSFLCLALMFCSSLSFSKESSSCSCMFESSVNICGSVFKITSDSRMVHASLSIPNHRDKQQLPNLSDKELAIVTTAFTSEKNLCVCEPTDTSCRIIVFPEVNRETASAFKKEVNDKNMNDIVGF